MSARPLSSRGPLRVEIHVPIQFEGPVHIGTGDRLSIVSDAPMLRDSDGLPYLPGASVRGVLRDWCEREAAVLGIDADAVERLFGAAGAAEAPGRQGRLTVFDAHLKNRATGEAADVVRDHVAISRAWGAAESGGKFDLEGAECREATLRLLYEGDKRDDPELVLLESGLSALRDGLLAFGGKTGWGLGAVSPSKKSAKDSADWFVCDRKNHDELETYLRSRCAVPGSEQCANGQAGAPIPIGTDDGARLGLKYSGSVARAGGSTPWSWLRLAVRLQFDGPMLVASPYRRATSPASGVSGSDHEIELQADATYQVDAEGKPVLPGSSLRGALRSHAWRIATTMERGAIAESLFGSTKKRGLIAVGEGLLDGDLKAIPLNHVAIDRVTGFAADTKLFSTAALASPAFNVSLTARWDSEQPLQQAAIALLLFTIRDFALHQGDVALGQGWVGSRTTRGYGWLRSMEILGCRGSVVLLDQSSVRRNEPFSLQAKSTVADIATSVPEVMEAWRSAISESKEISRGVR